MNKEDIEELKLKIEEGNAQLEYELLKEKNQNYKMSVYAKILTLYGCAIIALLLGIGIRSDWSYFHSGNVALLALIIGSYPIFGIFLTILEEAFSENGGV